MCVWSICCLGCPDLAKIQPYEIVTGVPAKHLRYRFTKDKIEFLLSFKWWEKDKKWIKDNANLFSNINDFQNK